MRHDEVWRHEKLKFFRNFSSTIKMVKLWGGVSNILIEGGQTNVYPFIDFYRFYWFFIDFIDFIGFIDFIDFLSILLILLIFYRFIDFYRFYWFLPILLIFQRFYPFLLVFDQFCLFSTYVNKFSPVCRAYVFLKRCVMYNIDQVLLWGVTRPLYQPRGCFYSRNTEKF